MSRVSVLILFLSCAVLKVISQDSQAPFEFKWSQLPPLPPGSNSSTQPGVAGAFIGVHQDALIIAGGANFPNGPAWEGGSKVYHDDIFVLENNTDQSKSWVEIPNAKLPRKIGYGLSLSTSYGIICLGGMNAATVSKDAFLLSWNRARRTIEIEVLPDLPVPLANMSGGVIQGMAYVAGSDEKTGQKYFLRLDLNSPSKMWTRLESWPGSPRTHAYSAVQNNGESEGLYLIKGRWKGSQLESTRLADAYFYNPTTNKWSSVDANSQLLDDEIIRSLSAGTAVPNGSSHILLFGGADGHLLNRLERLEVEINESKDSTLRKELIEVRDSLQKNHQGFSRDIWAFHTITETWLKVGILPHLPQVTTTAIRWGDEIIFPSGEIAPCIRTPEIHSLNIATKQYFGTLNYFILGAYLSLLVLLGIYFSCNQHSTNDFFRAGQRIPWWAAGLSIFGTQLSAITFMAIPAKTFATNWLYFFLNMTIILCAPFIIAFFLPFYRRFNLTTAYEYLENRFNLATRLVGSAMYIFLQLGRIGIVLLLPSLALSVVTGIDVHLCIVLMGVLSILYTVMGGIEAVIWTDVIQVIILLGGALLAVVILLLNLDFTAVQTHISNYDKLKIFDVRLDFSSPTLWVVLLGGFATNLIQYGSDQTVVQRYLTTKDEASAARSIWTGAWLSVPATLIFFGLGTLLFVFYKVHPQALNISLNQPDAIFPWFIVNELPNGISGLLIAAVFAASMSSLDSSMNSVSTVVITDFVKRLQSDREEQVYLKQA
ncbi:MAG: sodium/solute symporter, partial [Saprospiraceae bacterium]|nr:sodium/solute symporter [Saprospiraceae bacterium]